MVMVALDYTSSNASGDINTTIDEEKSDDGIYYLIVKKSINKNSYN